MYQTSSLDRQICSSPGEISLDFDISEYIIDDSEELNNDIATATNNFISYKFYVIDWNDEENNFNIGDKVKIQESKPFSKKKTWLVLDQDIKTKKDDKKNSKVEVASQ